MTISKLLLFLTGITLSGVAAFYSITGLAYIFAGAFYPVIVMGAALEAAKVVGASWVFRTWHTTSRFLSGYVAASVVVLMLITGIGIFGYLTRAYLVQQGPVTAITAQVDAAERDVALARETYQRDVDTLRSTSTGQTNAVVDRLAANDRLTGTNGAVNVLRRQQALVGELQDRVDASAERLQRAEQVSADVSLQRQTMTVDVGPLMFAARAWYGNTDTATMDKVVSWFIVLIMFTFDPMAIALILAAQSPKESPDAWVAKLRPFDRSTRDVAPWTPHLHQPPTPPQVVQSEQHYYEPLNRRQVHEPVHVVESDPIEDTSNTYPRIEDTSETLPRVEMESDVIEFDLGQPEDAAAAFAQKPHPRRTPRRTRDARKQ